MSNTDTASWFPHWPRHTNTRAIRWAMWQSVVLVSCLLAAAGAEQASQQNLNDFLGWFQRIGGAAPKLSLAQFDGMGSGVQATQAVREGDPVITVPLQWVAYVLTSFALSACKSPNRSRACLNSRRCRQSILASADPNTRDLFSSIQTDEQLVASFLVQQKALGDRSPWRPYIQVLPNAYNVFRVRLTLMFPILWFYMKALPKSIPLSLTLTPEELAEFQVRRFAPYPQLIICSIYDCFITAG